MQEPESPVAGYFTQDGTMVALTYWRARFDAALPGTGDLVGLSLGAALTTQLLRVSEDVTLFHADYTHRSGRYVFDPRFSIGVWRGPTFTFAHHPHNSTIYVRRSDKDAAHAWICEQRYLTPHPEAWDDVFLDDTTSVFRRDFEFFMKRRAWFAERGLAWKTGCLLYGPPGTGKTTAIRAAGRSVGMSWLEFDFTSPEVTDASFLKFMRSTGGAELSLFLFEDVDRLFPRDAAAEPSRSRISLSAFLNGIDGVVPLSGAVVVVTANHPEAIDQEVIARPARFAYRVEFRRPNTEQAIAYLTRVFRHDPLPQAALQHAAERLSGHSYAALQSLLQSAAVEASREQRDALTAADLDTAVDQFLASAQGLTGPRATGFKR